MTLNYSNESRLCLARENRARGYRVEETSILFFGKFCQAVFEFVKFSERKSTFITDSFLTQTTLIISMIVIKPDISQ